MATVRLVLVRHGESEWNAAGILQGHHGPGLTARGRVQADAVARLLLDDHPAPCAVVRSDLPRVAETAAATEKGLDIPVRVDERLRELDVGAWSGRTRADVAANDPDLLAAWRRGEDVAAGGAESFAQLRARVSEALSDVVTWAGEHAGDDPRPTVLVFTHGGPVRVAVAAALGLPLGGHRQLEPVANAAVSMLDAPRPVALLQGGGLLAAYNRVGHLCGDAPG